MKKHTPIIYAIILLLLGAAVIYLYIKTTVQSGRIEQMQLRGEIDSLYWVNKSLKSGIQEQEDKKIEVQAEKTTIIHHYHQFKDSIKASPDSSQGRLRDILIAMYRGTDKTPYLEPNLNREVNYRLAQGLEAKEIVTVQEKELKIDSSIIADQKQVISNNEQTISNMAEIQKNTEDSLTSTKGKLVQETKRKKTWRKIALWEGAGILGALAFMIL